MAQCVAICLQICRYVPHVGDNRVQRPWLPHTMRVFGTFECKTSEHHSHNNTHTPFAHSNITLKILLTCEHYRYGDNYSQELERVASREIANLQSKRDKTKDTKIKSSLTHRINLLWRRLKRKRRGDAQGTRESLWTFVYPCLASGFQSLISLESTEDSQHVSLVVCAHCHCTRSNVN